MCARMYTVKKKQQGTNNLLAYARVYRRHNGNQQIQKMYAHINNDTKLNQKKNGQIIIHIYLYIIYPLIACAAHAKKKAVTTK